MSDLWNKTKRHLDEGNFTALENELGGPDGFDRQITEWLAAGKFDGEEWMLAEALSCACMLGRESAAAMLINHGVDPYEGMRTGLAGPHYAVSGGHLDTVKMLIDRKVPLDVENAYGGTLLGQALWSAINEPRSTHVKIIEMLVDAGASAGPEVLEWWNEQPVMPADTKTKVAEILSHHLEFQKRVEAARETVALARLAADKTALADALKQLGNIERRQPFCRETANNTYAEAAELYSELARPLDAGWVIRHIGINHEYTERLTEAEAAYDQALALYRGHSASDDLDYANAVRYAAVIKERLGKRGESKKLWHEAIERYEKLGITDGVNEGKQHLADSASDRTISGGSS